MESKAHKGPEVLWRAGDIKRMVENLGRERTIEYIAEGIFIREYVEKRVDEIIEHADEKTITDCVLAGSGEINNEAAGA